MTLHGPLKAEVGIRDLHNQLSRYVQHVAAGGEVIVTSRGRPVARLGPVDEVDALADLRARGIVSDASGEWRPRADRPVVEGSLGDLVAEQRR